MIGSWSNRYVGSFPIDTRKFSVSSQLGIIVPLRDPQPLITLKSLVDCAIKTHHQEIIREKANQKFVRATEKAKVVEQPTVRQRQTQSTNVQKTLEDVFSHRKMRVAEREAIEDRYRAAMAIPIEDAPMRYRWTFAEIDELGLFTGRLSNWHKDFIDCKHVGDMTLAQFRLSVPDDRPLLSFSDRFATVPIAPKLGKPDNNPVRFARHWNYYDAVEGRTESAKRIATKKTEITIIDEPIKAEGDELKLYLALGLPPELAKRIRKKFRQWNQRFDVQWEQMIQPDVVQYFQKYQHRNISYADMMRSIGFALEIFQED